MANPHPILSDLLEDAATKLSPEAFRTYTLLLVTHYKTPTEFSEDHLSMVAAGTPKIVSEINEADLPYKISTYYQLEGWPLEG